MSTTTSDRSSVDEPRFRDVLRTLPRRVWIIALGVLVNQTGNFLPVFIVLYLSQRGWSAGAVGIVLGGYGLGKVLGNVAGGYLADRIGRRWTIVLSAVTTSGLTAGVPFLELLPVVAVAVGLVGLTSGIYRPAGAAVLVDSVVTRRQRLAAFGVFRLATNVGTAVGGVLGGVLASSSYVELFLSNAAACLLFGVIVVVLLRETPGPRPGQDGARTRAAGYRKALTDRTLVRFLLMTVLAMFVGIQAIVGLPLHVGAVGLSEHDFGLLMGFNGLLLVLLELPIVSVVARYRPEYVLVAGNLLLCGGFAVTGFATGMGVLAATVLTWTLGEMLYSSVAQAHLATMTPPGMVGRYQGLHGAAYAIGTGFGPVIGGAAYAVGPWALWTLTGVLGLLAAQLSLPDRSGPLSA